MAFLKLWFHVSSLCAAAFQDSFMHSSVCNYKNLAKSESHLSFDNHILVACWSSNRYPLTIVSHYKNTTKYSEDSWFFPLFLRKSFTNFLVASLLLFPYHLYSAFTIFSLFNIISMFLLVCLLFEKSSLASLYMWDKVYLWLRHIILYNWLVPPFLPSCQLYLGGGADAKLLTLFSLLQALIPCCYILLYMLYFLFRHYSLVSWLIPVVSQSTIQMIHPLRNPFCQMR